MHLEVLLSAEEYMKNEPFLIFYNDHTAYLRMGTYIIKMAQFSHPLFELYSSVRPLVYFIFTFQELQNSMACGSPFTLCSAL